MSRQTVHGAVTQLAGRDIHHHHYAAPSAPACCPQCRRLARAAFALALLSLAAALLALAAV